MKISHNSIKKHLRAISIFVLAFIFSIPDTSWAQSDGIVGCGEETTVVTKDNGATTTELANPCGYRDLVNLADSFIEWLIAVLIFAGTLLFVYAGFLYLTSAGDKSQAKKAKGIFTNVATGFFLVLISVVLISTIVTMLTDKDWESDWFQVVPLPGFSLHLDESPIKGDTFT